MTKRGFAIAAVVGAGALLLTGGLARGWADALRARGWLDVSVAIACGLGVGLALCGVDRLREHIVAAILYVAGLAALYLRWELPEERVHIAQYTALAALLLRASPRAWPLGIAVGIADELLQGRTPGRVFDPTDAAANVVVVIATAMWGSSSWRRLAALPPLTLAAALPFLRAGDAATTPIGLIPRGGTEQRVRADAACPGCDVLIVTIDALRADFARPWGQAPVPTPALDKLATESVAPERAWANALWTSPSIVSLLTGLHPATHGVDARALELAPAVVTPLETLSASGWTTWGSAGENTENYRNLGFDDELPEGRAQDRLAAVLAPLLPEDRVAIWLHLREIHAPYDATPEQLAALGLPSSLPAAPILDRARARATVPRADFPGHHAWLREPLRALYAAEVADADRAVGAVLRMLERYDRAGRTVLVVTADHGEELLEGDGIGHASTNLDASPRTELVRIPLWIRVPGWEGRTTQGDMQQIDVMPTVLSLVGLAAEEAGRGVPLQGADRSGELRTTMPTATPRFASSPCGWQCVGARRGERVYGVAEGDRIERCAERLGRCPGFEWVREYGALGARLGTPIPSPPPERAKPDPSPAPAVRLP
jgi:hypothetical protein